MNSIANDLKSILFPEELPPPNVSTAHQVHTRFWSDPYSKNLRLDHVEIEVRLGRNQPRRFDACVSKRSFAQLNESLQQYTLWDDVKREMSSVAYFESRDESLRAVSNADGTTYISKQRIFTSDYTIANTAYDFRIAASVEMPVSDRPCIARSTRRVTRDRVSYSLGLWRYDLTEVTEEDGTSSYQVELELINPLGVQISGPDATDVAKQLLCKLRDIFNVLEQDQDDLRIEHRRRKWT